MSLSSICGAVLLILLPGCLNIANAAEDDASVQRGEYLLHLGGCVSCHTAEDGQVLVGGLKMETEFGDFYTPNITPDIKTGIGNWSDDFGEGTIRIDCDWTTNGNYITRAYTVSGGGAVESTGRDLGFT